MKSLRREIASVFVLVLAASAVAVADMPQQAGSTEADKATIHAKVKSWAAASKARDAEAFASVYADDAVLMLEGAPDVSGREAILAAVTGLMKDPNFDLSFEADNVVVAGSGDLAYETGTYSFTLSDAEGKPAPTHGHYLVVWRKESDGTWKVVRDVPVSDPPEAAMAH